MDTTPYNDNDWINLAQTTAAHAGIEVKSLKIIATWDQFACANAIYYINDDIYLKVFGPTAKRQFYAERAALQTIAQHEGIPTPRLLAQGEPELAPPYLVLSEIPGDTAEHVWDELPRPIQVSLAEEIGRITAAIHRLPPHKLAAANDAYGGWPEQLATKQAAHIPLIESTVHLMESHRADIIRFMREETPRLLDTLTVTHYELAHNHIYLLETNRKWQVSGFIDWADAMIAPPEADIAFLWLWTFSRDLEAMRHCFTTLFADSVPPSDLGRRCLAIILHTHSMPYLWREFTAQYDQSQPIVTAMTEYLFPTVLFQT